MDREYPHGAYNIRNHARDVIADDEVRIQRFKRVWSERFERWSYQPVVVWSLGIVGAVAFFAIGIIPLG